MPERADDPAGLRRQCTLLLQSGRWAELGELLLQTLEHHTGEWHLIVQCAQQLGQLGRRREALAVAGLLAARQPPGAAAADALGTMWTFCGEPATAQTCFEGAVAAAAENPEYLFNLAMAQAMNGEAAAAEANLDAAIALRPDDHGAYHARANLRGYGADDNHIDGMLRLLRAGVPRARGETALCFAIAKELDDCGEHAEAFEYFKRGNDLQRRHMNYEVGDEVATIDRIVATHTAAALGAGARGLETDECVFIIGLPRSGTTLVESILAAHSQVYAAGELGTFPATLVGEMHRQAGAPMAKAAFVARSLEVDPLVLGRGYVDATRPQTGRAARFTDKLPLNYLYAGLIHRALPGARFIALTRDPMDSCYAMYRTLFASAYPFSYDLDDLGCYCGAWQRLIRHWAEVLGEALLIVSYEELAREPLAIGRRMLAHCGLGWEEGCAEFHRRRRAVATASSAQVRLPVYTSSIGKWRSVASQLEPLAASLERNGVVPR